SVALAVADLVLIGPLNRRKFVMQKWKVWLLIGLGVLGSLAVWVLLGRNVWHATSSSSGTNDVCRCDTSGHKVSFVTVEPGVQLEVLDWGGTGQTLVLLT